MLAGEGCSQASTAHHVMQVLFSDSSEPGEGEQKIMRFVRHQRLQVRTAAAAAALCTLIFILATLCRG